MSDNNTKKLQKRIKELEQKVVALMSANGELISKIEKLEAENKIMREQLVLWNKIGDEIEELEERIEEHVPSLPIIKAFEGK